MKYWPKRWFIFLLLAGFFLIYSSYYFSLRPKVVGNDMWIFNTPDETANYYFVDLFARQNKLTTYEPLNVVSGSLALVHPRSTTVVDNQIAPGSFLGFILIAGLLAKIFTVNIIPFIIPFFSVIAAWCFYLLVEKIFSRRIAFWSLIAFLFLPPLWYYSARSLFNNGLFVDFLLIGFYFLGRFLTGKKITNFLPAGILLGLALTMRPTEVIWVGFLTLSCFLLSKRRRQYGAYIMTLGLVVLAFIPTLWWQQKVFGHYLTTGYVPEGNGNLATSFWSLVGRAILPFGFNLKNIFYNLYHYFARMFWWYFWPATLGGIMIFYAWYKKSLPDKIRNYFLLGLAAMGYLLIYYGSWFFFNNLSGQALIGSSQVRYFLPLYIFSIPLVIYFFDFLYQKIIRQHFGAIIFVILIVIGSASLSVGAVYWHGAESLSAISKTIRQYQQINKVVRAKTTAEDVIITSYNDKVFFPARKVIFYWQEPRFLTNIGQISAQTNIYFYSIDRGRELSYIQDNSAFTAELIEQLNENESLYQLRLKK